MPPKKHEVNYSTRHAPTLARFHASTIRRRGVLGPIGSGKSTAMCMEIMRRAHEQEPGPDGIRRTRWAVVRNTYRELKDTTLKTWLDWFPEGIFGEFSQGDMAHRIKLGKVELEVLFRALDRPQDVAKVLSLEITGAWINEARELPFGLVQALDDRSGRFPSIRDGGCTWTGLMMDTNPPDDDHWWYRLAEEDRPEGWEFFRQPGGMKEEGGKFTANPKAENLPNLQPAFYETRAQGKQAPYIRVYYCGRYGFLSDAKPVYPEYGDDVHCTPSDILPIEGAVLYVGIDFGLTPAALFAQRSTMGRWIWIDELVTEDMGATKFAELLGQKLREEYFGYEMRIVGDPAGMQRSQVDERTPFAVLQAHGINAVPCETNDWIIRRDAVACPMMRLIEGKPGFLVSPKCKTARKGLAGGYCLRRLQVVGSERYVDKPEKNKYSHVCFVAGTAISTPVGSKPIEILCVGDLVNTPLGPRPVVFTGHRWADVLGLWLSNEQKIICTPDHPFWIKSGYCPADALRYADILYNEGNPLWRLQFLYHHFAGWRNGRSMNFGVFATTASRLRGITSRITNTATDICTEWCGKSVTAFCRMVMPSTTATAIPLTTESRILNWSQPASTPSCTWPTRNEGRPLDHVWGRLSRRRQIGVEPIPTKQVRSAAREWLGIGKSEPRLELKSGNVSGAGLCSTPTPGRHIKLARRSVDRLRGGPWALMTRIGTALFAAARSVLTAMRVNKPVRVIARTTLSRCVVHNIEVADAHCFFAESVLVSNCEAGQYAMVGGGEGYAVVGMDVEDDSFDWYEQQDADRHYISGY